MTETDMTFRDLFAGLWRHLKAAAYHASEALASILCLHILLCARLDRAMSRTSGATLSFFGCIACWAMAMLLGWGVLNNPGLSNHSVKMINIFMLVLAGMTLYSLILGCFLARWEARR